MRTQRRVYIYIIELSKIPTIFLISIILNKKKSKHKNKNKNFSRNTKDLFDIYI